MRLPRLKEVREGHGWSQKKLAEESGVSRDSISNYETGQRDAWPATAKKLADALGVEIADLRVPTLEPALPKVEAPVAGPPRVSRERLQEHFEGVRQDEVDYLNSTIRDFWRLAAPGEKPRAHSVPDNIDPDRVWGFLKHALGAGNVFEPEQVERINRGALKAALAGKG